MKAIFKREFSAYIHSVVGLLFMAVTVFFFGLYGAVYNLSLIHISEPTRH